MFKSSRYSQCSICHGSFSNTVIDQHEKEAHPEPAIIEIIDIDGKDAVVLFHDSDKGTAVFGTRDGRMIVLRDIAGYYEAIKVESGHSIRVIVSPPGLSKGFVESLGDSFMVESETIYAHIFRLPSGDKIKIGFGPKSGKWAVWE